jgi:hypothetical protein
MEPHKTYQLYADLFENGRKIDIRDLSGDEQTAVLCELEDMWMDTYCFQAHLREFIASISRDDEDVYLCAMEGGIQTAFPDDCMLREITIGAPKINERTLKLVGDRIPLRLPARRLEVLFSDI